MQHDILRRSRSHSVDSDDDVLDNDLDEVTHGGHNTLSRDVSSADMISFEDETPLTSGLPPRAKGTQDTSL